MDLSGDGSATTQTPVGGRGARGFLLGILVAFILAVLVGCGGDESGEAGDVVPDFDDTGEPFKPVELPDPCTLLTPSEIETVIGNSVGEGNGGETAGVRGCAWSNEAGNAVGRGVTIELQGPTEVYSAKELFESNKEQMTDKPDTLQNFSGLGDGAYGVINDLNASTKLRVLKGDINLTVGVGEADTKTQEHLDMAEELAKLAVARL